LNKRVGVPVASDFFVVKGILAKAAQVIRTTEDYGTSFAIRAEEDSDTVMRIFVLEADSSVDMSVVLRHTNPN
jgi:hypothetical protein